MCARGVSPWLGVTHFFAVHLHISDTDAALTQRPHPPLRRWARTRWRRLVVWPDAVPLAVVRGAPFLARVRAPLILGAPAGEQHESESGVYSV